MGTATAPVRGSGSWPAWTARVAKPRFLGSPFTARILAAVAERKDKIPPDERAVLSDALGRTGPPHARPDAPAGRGGLDGLRDPRAGGRRDPPPSGARRARHWRGRRLRVG